MSGEKKHAILAPSSADRWMVCPGSVLLEQDIEEKESEYAKEGTLAHAFAASILSAGEEETWKRMGTIEDKLGYDSISPLFDYVDSIRRQSKDHHLLIEQSLSVGHITLEDNAEGTGDAIIIHDDEETLEIRDLKFGMGNRVYAKKNKQLMLYALGARHQFSMLGDFKKFILAVHQPRLDHLDEWECSLEELLEFADEVKFRVEFIWRLIKGEVKFNPGQDLVPTERGCQFCKANPCPKLSEHILKTVSEDFVDISKNPVAKLNTAIEKLEKADNQQLAWFMQNLGIIEDWCKAVRARTTAELLAGKQVPGYKLVTGRRGDREWKDEKEVEEVLKSMRLKQDEIYKFKLISPSQAEKKFKKEPKRWDKLTQFITQKEGSPSVAPTTDPRPSLDVKSLGEDFEVITD